MPTLIVNIDNNVVDTDKIISAISLINGIKNVELQNGVPKTKTQEFLDRMEAGEDISDDEYLGSISGFYEELDASYNEVINTPKEQRIRKLDWEWDV